MRTPSRCPICGIEDKPTDAPCARFRCGTFFHGSDYTQSPECKARVKALIAEETADNESKPTR